MAGTTIDVGAVQVYLKRRLSDSWTEHTALDPAGMVMTTAGHVTDLLLHQSYAPGVPPGRLHNLHKWWVKLVYTPVDAAAVVLWVGNIEDARDAEDEQGVKWIAASLEAQMRKLKLTEAYAAGFEDIDDDQTPCQKVATLRFNEYMTRAAPEGWGRRSTPRYHFGSGGVHNRLAAYTAGDDTLDCAYAFGTDADWTNLQILEALLAWYAPAGYGSESETPYGGRKQMCPIGIRLGLTTAAQTYLGNAIEGHDLNGLTLLEAVDRLVGRAGPLFWWLDWEDWEDATQSYALLRVASRLWADEGGTATVEDVTLAECMPAVVRSRVKDRATQVIARGAPIRAMFSASQSFAHWNEEFPTHQKFWTDAQQADWLANGMFTSYGERPKPEWDAVFLAFTIREDWLNDGVSPSFYLWQSVMLLPDLMQDGATISEAPWPTITEPELRVLQRGGYYPRPRPLLPANLTWRGYTNPTANSGLPSAPAGFTGEPEHDAILCWYVPTTVSAGEPVVRIAEVARLRDRAGVRIRRKRYRLEEPPFLAEATAPDTYERWHELIFTVSAETDNLLQAVASHAGDVPDDQRRTAIVEVPDAEWWAAAKDTVVDVAEDGTKTTIWGVLRNDYPRLKDIASQRLKILDQRVPHYHGTIRYKWTVPEARVGDWIGTYGRYAVHAPIMTVAHELMDLKTWGTELTTFKPQSMRDTP